MRVFTLWPSSERMIEALVSDTRMQPTPTMLAPRLQRPGDMLPLSGAGPPPVAVARRTAKAVVSVSVSVPETVVPPVTPAIAWTTAPPPIPSVSPIGTPPTNISRWNASAWLIARGTGTAALAPGGILGGSQAGMRVAWRPVPDVPAALFGRVSRPLRTMGAEAAIGIEVQPLADLPVRVALEQRFALERGAAAGTAISAIGGVGDVGLPGGFRLDGYGQAGIIGLRRRAAFVDGSATVVRSIASFGDAEIQLGVGVWGAAQPGLSRLDIGPRAELRLPVASQHVRLGVEWRERIAGNARPGSGPALTIGADF